MKKFVSVVSALVLCLAIFAGCGAKEVSLSEAMDKINSDFSLSLKKVESTDDLNRYYNIESADVKQFAAEQDSNSNAPTEIVLVEAVDSDAANRVSKALEARYNSIYSQYSSYTPDKLDTVKACKVTVDDNFVTMIVADKAPDMLETFYGFIK